MGHRSHWTSHSTTFHTSPHSDRLSDLPPTSCSEPAAPPRTQLCTGRSINQSAMAGSRPSISPDSQPRPFNEDDPPVHSQPAISSHERIIDNKARRTITTGDEDASRFSLQPYGELPRASYANTKHLRDAVFSLIVARLKKQNITSSLLQENHFRWILPIRYLIWSVESFD